MKNEEKAKELANYYASETDYKETVAYDAAHAMAEWKDEQFAKEKQSIIEEQSDGLITTTEMVGVILMDGKKILNKQ